MIPECIALRKLLEWSENISESHGISDEDIERMILCYYTVFYGKELKALPMKFLHILLLLPIDMHLCPPS